MRRSIEYSLFLSAVAFRPHYITQGEERTKTGMGKLGISDSAALGIDPEKTGPVARVRLRRSAIETWRARMKHDHPVAAVFDRVTQVVDVRRRNRREPAVPRILENSCPRHKSRRTAGPGKSPWIVKASEEEQAMDREAALDRIPCRQKGSARTPGASASGSSWPRLHQRSPGSTWPRWRIRA